MAAFRTALEEIRALGRDRRSGAAQLADRAAAALLTFLRRSTPETPQLAALAYALRRVQPAMAPLLNLAHLVGEAARRSRMPCYGAIGISPGKLRQVVERFRRQLRGANRQIAQRFAAGQRRGSVVLTYSYSSTVLAALIAARRKLARVICSEARPQREGRRLAARLARAGIRVVLVTDAALPGRVREADAVAVGADAILTGAYVNKTGTRVLQQRARAARKPFYVLADRSKILPRVLARHLRIGRSFERVPLGPGVNLLTERAP